MGQNVPYLSHLPENIHKRFCAHPAEKQDALFCCSVNFHHWRYGFESLSPVLTDKTAAISEGKFRRGRLILPPLFIIDSRKILKRRKVFPISIIIGIDHGYYAIKTAHCSFPAGLTSYGEHEPYTRQGLLEFGGCFFVCGSGRQPIQRDKTVNDNYYLLTLAAIAREILQRGLPPECSVRIAAGLPLTSFGRDKPKFKDYLLRSNQPVNFKFEGVEYSITIEEVAVFPQGYAALMTETGLLQDEPSMLLMDLGGWTVDLMRIDNAIPAADTAHSLELGMIRCVDDIREQVRRETGLSLTDAQIENMLAGQPCTVSDLLPFE